jgi:hypothetical protein
MIYQHATRDRDRAIAKGLGAFVRDAQRAATSRRTTRNMTDAKTGDDAGAAA